MGTPFKDLEFIGFDEESVLRYSKGMSRKKWSAYDENFWFWHDSGEHSIRQRLQSDFTSLSESVGFRHLCQLQELDGRSRRSHFRSVYVGKSRRDDDWEIKHAISTRPHAVFLCDGIDDPALSDLWLAVI